LASPNSSETSQRRRHAPTHFVARLEEPVVAVDPTSNQKSEQLPTFNAYSIDGDVTGPLVYVNYGRPEDYDVLDRCGVSVQGAIVVARYGESWRGIKPKVAAEHGAIGCLIPMRKTMDIPSATCFRTARCVRPMARSAGA